ncbi:MAG: CoA-binding protein [Desulforegulaceae bacterium]|nr:CoA-binding protein [Desulforegulaceae bacterium]
MTKGKIITNNNEIRDILENSKKIAVLGISFKKERDSYIVSNYLIEKGYEIIPVRPGGGKIFGLKVHENLDSIHEKIDILDVFRSSEHVTGHIEEALRLKPKVFWMQLGVKNQEAAKILTENGIDVIMDRCIKIEHKRLCGQYNK